MKDESKEVLTPDEVMQVLGIGRSTVYKLLTKGKIKCFRIGKIWRIPAAEVQKYIDNSLGGVNNGNADRDNEQSKTKTETTEK